MNSGATQIQIVRPRLGFTLIALALVLMASCIPASNRTPPVAVTQDVPETNEEIMDIMKKPLVTDIYTADPSAHVFDGKIYI